MSIRAQFCHATCLTAALSVLLSCLPNVTVAAGSAQTKPSSASFGDSGVTNNPVASEAPAQRTAGQPSVAFGALNWTVLVAYLGAMVGIGCYFSGREKSTNDFFLAGGRIPWWAAGLSIFGTMLSAITYLSIPAVAYEQDWVRLLLGLGVVAVAPFVIFCYLPFVRYLKVITAYEYIERRYSLGLRLFGSTSFVLYQLARMGVVVLLPALALSTATGISAITCILIMGALSTLYTVMGGIEAVIWTDVVQVIVLLGGAIAALVIIIMHLDGGFGEILSTGWEQGKFRLVDFDWALDKEGILVIVLGAIFTNNLPPYTTDQAVVQRYLTTPTERQASRAIWTNAILSVPALLLFFFLGTALYVFYQVYPDRVITFDKADKIFPWFIAHEMPAGLAGLVIAGVFAASMSSLDSSMHSITTVITTDFVRRLGPLRSEHEYLSLARLLTAVVGFLGTVSAIILSLMEIKYLWDVFLTCAGLFLGSLCGLFLLGIFTRRTTWKHAWMGAVLSVVVLGLLQIGPTLESSGRIGYAPKLNSLLYGPISIGTCFAVGWIASLIAPGDPQASDGMNIFTVNRSSNEERREEHS